MTLYGVIIFASIAIAIILAFVFVVRKFFGTSGILFSTVVIGFFIGGIYSGSRLGSSDDSVSKYSYCSPASASNYIHDYTQIYYFPENTVMGTKIEANNLYTTLYPNYYLSTLYITENEINLVDGKILCIDANKGQMLLESMVEGCNP